MTGKGRGMWRDHLLWNQVSVTNLDPTLVRLETSPSSRDAWLGRSRYETNIIAKTSQGTGTGTTADERDSRQAADLTLTTAVGWSLDGELTYRPGGAEQASTSAPPHPDARADDQSTGEYSIEVFFFF